MIIAIDGPAGSGKSTISKMVAKELGFSYLDTGAMYRAVAYMAKKEGVAFDDEEKCTLIAGTCPIDFGFDDGEPIPSRVFIAGIDVTDDIRSGDMDMGASDVSAISGVRRALVEQQRRIGYAGDYVVEGRDIGSVVFPTAEVKVFLTADDTVRAYRRLKQNEERGKEPAEYDDVLSDLRRRDYNDSHREDSPLVQVEDAHLVDTTNMTINEVVDVICGYVR